MDRRWEERRAQAARRTDPTVSVVLKRERAVPPSAAPAIVAEPTSELPSAEHVLADLQQLEHITAANGGIEQAPSFLRNTPRAMLVVVLVANSVLITLLYAAGFLG